MIQNLSRLFPILPFLPRSLFPRGFSSFRTQRICLLISVSAALSVWFFDKERTKSKRRLGVVFFHAFCRGFCCCCCCSVVPWNVHPSTTDNDQRSTTRNQKSSSTRAPTIEAQATPLPLALVHPPIHSPPHPSIHPSIYSFHPFLQRAHTASCRPRYY